MCVCVCVCVCVCAAELSEGERQQEDVSRLSETLERAREELEKEEREAEAATCQARASREELQAAEREYEQLLQWSTADPEFARLQAELSQHRQGGPEEMCQQLRKELEAVQEEYYAHRWRKAKGGGGVCHLSGCSDPSQMHKPDLQEHSRNYFDESPSSSPVDGTADLMGGGAVGAQGGPASLTNEGCTLHTPPEILSRVKSSRVLSPWQQARPHKPPHSACGNKTGPLTFGGWEQPARAVVQREFTSAAGHK